MKRRLASVWAPPYVGLLGLTILSSSCQSDNSAGPAVTFKIEVLGPAEALVAYPVEAVQADAVPDTRYQFVSRLPWTQLPATTFVVSSNPATGTLGQVSLHPFVCQEDPAFDQRLKSGRWKALETQQVYLMSDGSLEAGTDFDHLLYYECDWTSDDGRSQVGSVSLADTPQLCSESDRNRTSVILSGTLFGVPFEEAPVTCSVTLTNETPKKLTVVVGIANMDLTLSVSLQHCVDPNETPPVMLNAPSDVPCTIRGAVEAVSQVSGKRNLELSSGRWTIDSVSYSKDGRLSGAVDAVFTDGNDMLTLVGQIDLPILRQPVNPGG